MSQQRVWIIAGLVAALCLLICVAAVLVAGVAVWRASTAAIDPGPPIVLSPVIEHTEPGEVTESPAETLLPEEAETLLEQIARVEVAVADIRGLEPLYDIPEALMTEEELRTRIEEEFFEDYTPEEARDDVIMLSAFDLLDADFELYQFYIDLYTEQIAGYYDPEDEEVFVIGDHGIFTASDEATYAHEFTHVLQDQYHDLEAFVPDDDEWYDVHRDEAYARTALVEGDAVLTEQQYLLTAMPIERIQELLDEIDELDLPVFDSAPEVIRRDLMFPYIEGFTFVQALYEEGGYAAVDAAYSDPPIATEQILHPERYLDDRDLPQDVTLEDGLEVLGDDYRLVYEQHFGEFYLILYLETQLYADQAALAAEGWDGDRYAVYYNDETGDLAMVLRTVWDDRGEAFEFYETFRGFGEAWADASPSLDSEGLACWSAEDELCIAWMETETVIVRAPTRALAEGLLEQYAVAVP